MRNLPFTLWLLGHNALTTWEVNKWHERGDIHGVLSDAQFLCIALGYVYMFIVAGLLYERRISP